VAEARLSAFPPESLASAVTSLAMLGAGGAVACLARLGSAQPAHWRRCWDAAALVGVTTLGLHGFGEPAGGASLRAWSFADTSANLALAFLVLLAAARDFAPEGARRALVLAFGAVSTLGVAHVGAEKFLGGAAGGLELHALGALSGSQLALVADYAAVLALFWRGRERMPPRARRLLPLLGATAAVGLLLAMPDGERVDFGFVAYHAIWHLVGAFLVALLWLVQELRFAEAAR